MSWTNIRPTQASVDSLLDVIEQLRRVPAVVSPEAFGGSEAHWLWLAQHQPHLLTPATRKLLLSGTVDESGQGS